MQYEYTLSISFDEKRCGYFVSGCGLDFFMYFTGASGGGDFEAIESEEITKEGYPTISSITIPIKSKDGKIGRNGYEVIKSAIEKKDIQILETQIFNELQRRWGCHP